MADSKISPRKFSEKIALLNKKEAEGNAKFEEIIKEVQATKNTCHIGQPTKSHPSNSNNGTVDLEKAKDKQRWNDCIDKEELEEVYQSLMSCVNQYGHNELPKDQASIRVANNCDENNLVCTNNNIDNNSNRLSQQGFNQDVGVKLMASNATENDHYYTTQTEAETNPSLPLKREPFLNINLLSDRQPQQHQHQPHQQHQQQHHHHHHNIYSNYNSNDASCRNGFEHRASGCRVRVTSFGSANSRYVNASNQARCYSANIADQSLGCGSTCSSNGNIGANYADFNYCPTDTSSHLDLNIQCSHMKQAKPARQKSCSDPVLNGALACAAYVGTNMGPMACDPRIGMKRRRLPSMAPDENISNLVPGIKICAIDAESRNQSLQIASCINQHQHQHQHHQAQAQDQCNADQAFNINDAVSPPDISRLQFNTVGDEEPAPINKPSESVRGVDSHWSGPCAGYAMPSATEPNQPILHHNHQLGPKWASSNVVCADEYSTTATANATASNSSYQAQTPANQRVSSESSWPIHEPETHEQVEFVAMTEYGLNAAPLDASQLQPSQSRVQAYGYQATTEFCNDDNSMGSYGVDTGQPNNRQIEVDPNRTIAGYDSASCSNILRSNSHNNIDHLVASHQMQPSVLLSSQHCLTNRAQIRQHQVPILGQCYSNQISQVPMSSYQNGRRQHMHFCHSNSSLRSQVGSVSPIDSSSNLTSPHLSGQNSPVAGLEPTSQQNQQNYAPTQANNQTGFRPACPSAINHQMKPSGDLAGASPSQSSQDIQISTIRD